MPTITINCKVMTRIKEAFEPDNVLAPRDNTWRTDMAGEIRKDEKKSSSSEGEYEP